MTALTHIAGLLVTVDDRFMRQRCGWCGASLLDYDLSRIAVPAGQDPVPASWEMGCLVRVDGPMATLVVDASDVQSVDNLPPDSCARLDPAVTL